MSAKELTRTCPHCDGKGREWHMQGGPHGIGRMGKCHVCKGQQKVTEAKYRWHQRVTVGPSDAIPTDRTYHELA